MVPRTFSFVTTHSERSKRLLEIIAVALFLIILGLQLFFSVRDTSQTWDEANHIFTGYRSWTHKDHGLNPEHPPLLKLIAALPLFSLPLTTPTIEDRYFKEAAFLSGKDFLYKNDADKILLRARLAAATLTLLLALLVYLGTKEMFGKGAAFIALALLTFDPNLLAHGALVTTDAGLACFMFASVYTFYRYVKVPSLLRLVIVGVSVGLALAVKHTGVLIIPTLLVLAACEAVRSLFLKVERPSREILKLAASLIAITVIVLALLWTFYGFRYQARPDGLQLNPPLVEYVQGLEPHESWVISKMAHWRILPESYLYGLVDVRQTANYYTSFVLGKVYAHGVWLDGTIVISASNLSSVEFGPGSLDPYGQFKQLTPTAVIDYGVFVFDGHFEMPLASALGRIQKAHNFLAAKQLQEALTEAQAAVALAPDSVQVQLALGDVLREMGQAEQARDAYQKALELAKTIEPDFQIRSIPEIEGRLGS